MLEQLVNLYRHCAKSNIEAGIFSGTVNNPEGVDALRDFLDHGWQQRNVGDVDNLTANEVFVPNEEQLPENTQQADFSISLAANSSTRFYEDVKDLIRVARIELSRGSIPREYFLWRSNLYTEDPGYKPPHELTQLSLFIKGFESLSNHRDDTRNGPLKLIYVCPLDLKKSPVVVLPINLDSDIVSSIAKLDLQPLDDITHNAKSDDIHLVAKQDVFRTALAEFLCRNNSEGFALQFLVSGWEAFIEEYQRDLATYLSGFSFHKARREVANAQMEIAQNFSSISADIGTKALSVPVAVVAILAFPDENLTVLTSLILVFGMTIASYVIFKTLEAQHSQFELICQGKNLTLNSFDGDKRSFPDDLITEIQETESKLCLDEQKQRRLLSFLKFIAWAPLVATLCYIYFTYDAGDRAIRSLLEIEESVSGTVIRVPETEEEGAETMPATDISLSAENEVPEQPEAVVGEEMQGLEDGQQLDSSEQSQIDSD